MAAANEFGVTVPAISLPMTKTYHGITILSESGQIVGRIQNFNPVFASREGSHIYELNAETWGRPIDYVPGKETGRTITCSRVEVWTEETEIAFGNANDVARSGGVEWQDLCEQTQSIVIQEALFKSNVRYRAWEYLGCWFKSKAFEGYQAEGNAKIVANCEFAYVTRKALV